MDPFKWRRGADVTETTWSEIASLINGLWPEADWQPIERELWLKKLGPLDVDIVKTSIEEVAATNTRKKPALAWVLATYNKLREQLESQNRMDAWKMESKSKEVEDEEFARCRAIQRERLIEVIEGHSPECISIATKEVTRKLGVQFHHEPIADWSHLKLEAVHYYLKQGDEHEGE